MINIYIYIILIYNNYIYQLCSVYHMYIIYIMYIYIHTCMHACIHACMHAYIQTDRHTDIHTYIHTYRHTYIHTDRQTYRHTYIHTDIHTYRQTYIHTLHTYVSMHVYIYICIFWSWCIPIYVVLWYFTISHGVFNCVVCFFCLTKKHCQYVFWRVFICIHWILLTVKKNVNGICICDRIEAVNGWVMKHQNKKWWWVLMYP